MTDTTPTKKKFKLGLLPMIIIAILLGVGAGYIFPDWLSRIFVTFNSIFSEFLNFTIPLIIIGFVSPAIAEIGNTAGKMLVATVIIAYVETICSGLISYFTGVAFFPGLITHASGAGAAITDAAKALTPYFVIEFPEIMTVMSALVLSFILGLGTASLRSTAMRSWLVDLRDIIQMVIRNCIVPLLPIYIFGIFLNMTVSGQVGPVMSTFAKIIIVIFIIHIVVLLLQYAVAALFATGRISRNPLTLLRTMLPAYFTALGTQSSAATIPVTLKQTIKMGVDEDVAGFTIPLCATIHLSGSTLKIVACALALMMMQGHPYGLNIFIGFIAMLGITMVAAPGVPGGAIMASLGILSSMLGFSEADCALMIALYITMDSFGTACNVTGDGSIAVIVNRFFGRRPTPAAEV